METGRRRRTNNASEEEQEVVAQQPKQRVGLDSALIQERAKHARQLVERRKHCDHELPPSLAVSPRSYDRIADPRNTPARMGQSNLKRLEMKNAIPPRERKTIAQ